MRAAVVLAGLLACSEPARLPVDGGGFVLPDAGERRDVGADAEVDAGPACRTSGCGAGEYCGCRVDGCGCFAPSALGEPCDPAHASCRAGQCLEVRLAEGRAFACTDGTAGAPCSRDSASVCTTAHGCVCLTNGATVCTCDDDLTDNEGLCDLMRGRETCPVATTCVREDAPGGLRYVCSDGAEGQPCEPNDGSCETTLGCTCPRVAGRDRCQCSEPGQAGEPCDVRVAGACEAPLECVTRVDGPGQLSTVCGRAGSTDAGVVGCDPSDPNSCPLGWECVPQGGGFVCRSR